MFIGSIPQDTPGADYDNNEIAADIRSLQCALDGGGMQCGCEGIGSTIVDVIKWIFRQIRIIYHKINAWLIKTFGVKIDLLNRRLTVSASERDVLRGRYVATPSKSYANLYADTFKDTTSGLRTQMKSFISLLHGYLRGKNDGTLLPTKYESRFAPYPNLPTIQRTAHAVKLIWWSSANGTGDYVTDNMQPDFPAKTLWDLGYESISDYNATIASVDDKLVRGVSNLQATAAAAELELDEQRVGPLGSFSVEEQIVIDRVKTMVTLFTGVCEYLAELSNNRLHFVKKLNLGADM